MAMLNNQRVPKVFNTYQTYLKVWSWTVRRFEIPPATFSAPGNAYTSSTWSWSIKAGSQQKSFCCRSCGWNASCSDFFSAGILSESKAILTLFWFLSFSLVTSKERRLEIWSKACSRRVRWYVTVCGDTWGCEKNQTVIGILLGKFHLELLADPFLSGI